MEMSDISLSAEASASNFLSAEIHGEARQYQHRKLKCTLLALSVHVVILALLGLLAAPLLDQVFRGWVGDNPWLRLLLFGAVTAGAVELVSLPVDFWSSYVLEHRYGLSTQSFGRWVWHRIKSTVLIVPFGVGALCAGYALIWYTGHWWWILATVAWLLFTLVLGRILPVLILPLFFRISRLEDRLLVERLSRLIEGTGLKLEGVFRLDLSKMTRKANAALAGLGRSRRVLLGDTLLREFTPEEIEVVFAHEVGHHVFRHLPKMLILQVIFATAGLFLADRVLVGMASVLHYQGTGMLAPWQDPSALPLLLLVLTAFTLVNMPLLNAVSRAFERQCDRYALRRTGLVDAYRSAFQKLALLNKVDPDPPALAVWFLEDHPPLRERLALADTPLS
jgi:STE24 endopeptidase